MRVISGKARRINLKTPVGLDTRPTTDRIKETLFNMINQDMYDCVFVDLFSGSGAIGIESLSRGAAYAYFIDNNKNAIACIKDNLKATKLENEALVIQADVINSLNRIDKTPDYIFMDPPYNTELERSVLIKLDQLNIISKETVIIIEASLQTTFDYLEEIGYYIIREKIYKTNKHIFVKKICE